MRERKRERESESERERTYSQLHLIGLLLIRIAGNGLAVKP